MFTKIQSVKTTDTCIARTVTKHLKSVNKRNTTERIRLETATDKIRDGVFTGGTNMNKPKLLRLNLQTFAEEPPAEPIPPVDPPTPTYTQADIDRIVGERLAREKQKAEKTIADAQAEAERKRLEEESEFKTLYEQSQARIAEIEAQAKASELQAKKQSLLLEAGYTADKLADLLDFVTGEDEESVKVSVDKLLRVAPPKAQPVDPAVNGGGRQQPEQQDGSELGKAMYERIKNKLR